jgi:hypothetical protein
MLTKETVSRYNWEGEKEEVSQGRDQTRTGRWMLIVSMSAFDVQIKLTENGYIYIYISVCVFVYIVTCLLSDCISTIAACTQ